MNSFPRTAVFLVFPFFALAFPVWSGPPAAERTDRYGDALPLGAVARLGSVRLRHDNLPGLLAFAADNKTLAVLTVQDKVNRLWLWNVTLSSWQRNRPPWM